MSSFLELGCEIPPRVGLGGDPWIGDPQRVTAQRPQSPETPRRHSDRTRALSHERATEPLVGVGSEHPLPVPRHTDRTARERIFSNRARTRRESSPRRAVGTSGRAALAWARLVLGHTQCAPGWLAAAATRCTFVKGTHIELSGWARSHRDADRVWRHPPSYQCALLASLSQAAATSQRRSVVLHGLLEKIEALLDFWLCGPAVLPVQVTLAHLDNLRGATLDLDGAATVGLRLHGGGRKVLLDDGSRLVALLPSAIS